MGERRGQKGEVVGRKEDVWCDPPLHISIRAQAGEVYDLHDTGIQTKPVVTLPVLRYSTPLTNTQLNMHNISRATN